MDLNKQDFCKALFNHNSRNFQLFPVRTPPYDRICILGLCGNWNDVKEDELTLRDGSITSDLNTWGTNWKENDDEVLMIIDII